MLLSVDAWTPCAVGEVVRTLSLSAADVSGHDLIVDDSMRCQGRAEVNDTGFHRASG